MSDETPAGIIRRVFYNGRLRNTISKLGLSGPLKSFYFAAFSPRRGYLDLKIDGLKARFICDSPTTFRFLEATEAKETPTLRQLLQFVRVGDVTYDVGASFGMYTVFLAMRVGVKGRVVAFEPEKRSHNYLLANVEANQLKNVLPHRLALGSEGKQAFLGGNFGGFSLLRQQNESQTVNVLPGDSLVRHGNLPVPRVVKIDVEGFELEVIKGLTETLRADACALVLCEIHPTFLPAGTTPQDVEGALRDRGFAHIQTYPRGNTYHAIARKNAEGA